MSMRFILGVLWACALACPIWAGPLAQFRTTLGEIDVELFDQNKPVTVQNFIRCVQTGVYNDMFFHRWVPQLVIQGGGYRVANRNQTNAIVQDVTAVPAITNEFSVGRIFSNLYGTIAMARSQGQTNSATSQFFFNLTNNSFLDTFDGGFTVFGRVIAGSDVLERFNQPTTNNGIFLLNIGSPLDELPVLKQRQATYRDLIYVDISLLNVQVRELSVGQKEISWNSVSNKLHRVQFTTQTPPLWQELIRTNGTGQVMTAVDSDGASQERFYRVLVDY